MLYISHSDATERLARIQRVRQGIADSQVEASLRLSNITKDCDKGKGLEFSSKEHDLNDLNDSRLQQRSHANLRKRDLESDGESEASSSKLPFLGGASREEIWKQRVTEETPFFLEKENQWSGKRGDWFRAGGEPRSFSKSTSKFQEETFLCVERFRVQE
ncbi:unnamed protein product [Eruca vesicaria subsp. sativa]|uniref:Uncharacterized protein n=1 Tax=Eruca vesicaria subsp. sativa TaxID=29727 RepID=A0ABC8K5Z7_ERUVS|nr:unnamed protein product [Eruca vesicaria subsp. sativa]